MPFATIRVRKEPHYRRDALERGLKRLGYTITPEGTHTVGRDALISYPKSRDDLLVLWNLKAGFDEDDARKFEKRGGTVIVMENAYLQRQDKTRYALSVHGHNGDGWFPHDPIEDRFTVLGVPHLPWRDFQPGTPVLVCAQRGIGSRRMRSPAGWDGFAVARFQRALGGQRKVILRPHPGNFAPKVPPEVDLLKSYACVIWTSSIGVRALTLGVPVFVCGPRWICSDVAHDPRTLARDRPDPGIPFHQSWHHYDTVHASLNRMAHGQWSFEEIATGEPFARMRDHGWGVEEWA